MATSGSQHTRPKCGIIILGNTGSGKSFLCNILIGKYQFASEFSAQAVTLETEHCEIPMANGIDLLIFNIPGLIERKQDRIDKNKEQIIKAFEQCPNSIVIFVWSAHVGGRPQTNDLIGFGALYKAYQFPPNSFIYIVNMVERNKSDPKYQATFLTEIQEGLEEEEKLNVDPKDTVFIEQMDFNNEIQRVAEREKLLKCISKHHPAIQSRKADIILQKDQLKKLREDLIRHQAEAEKDREIYESKINKMYEAIRSHQAEAGQDRGNYERIGLPPDPATLVIAASTGAVIGGVSGAVHGFGTGINTVVNGISDFATDRDIPLPVRVVVTPLATIGGTVVAPVVAVGTAVVSAVDGIADGVKAVFRGFF